MYRIAFGALLSTHLFVSLAASQSLTPDELRALVDERVNETNPYQELLADPDPARSLAALQIMLESGDQELERIALQFGFLSSNATVRRQALEAHIDSGPFLTAVLDASAAIDDRDLLSVIRNLGGALSTNGEAAIRFSVGEKNEGASCFMDRDGNCRVVINADGLFITIFRGNSPYLSARTFFNDSGELIGTATLFNVTQSLPIRIRLAD